MWWFRERRRISGFGVSDSSLFTSETEKAAQNLHSIRQNGLRQAQPTVGGADGYLSWKPRKIDRCRLCLQLRSSYVRNQPPLTVKQPSMPQPSQHNPIVIIGAGVGGLSAAIRLAVAGKKVVILDKNPIVGGKMNQYMADGFYWDTGPSIITMRHVFEDLFAAAGRSLDEYVSLLPLDPLTRYYFADGTRLDATRDLTQMATQIAQFDERDVEGYLRFMAFAAQVHRITGPAFIYDQPPTLTSLTKVPPLDIFKAGIFGTLDQKIRQSVRSPQMRQLLGRYATYVGASPFLAPATLSVIAHVELMGGLWYPQGGIHEIASGMARLARETGVDIRLNTAVEEIVVQGDLVRGVRTADGAIVDAEAVIANVDVATVYQQLLPPQIATAKRVRRLTTVERSCSGFVLLLGVEGTFEELLHHNIFFCRDYRREFDDIFKRGIPPAEPTIYVSISSKTDADHAPPGCENWFVLVNAPADSGAGDSRGGNSGGFDWANEAVNYRNRVLDALAAFGVDVRQRIRHEKILTPLDIAQISGAWQGALYGISSNKPLNAFRRQHNRCGDVSGLYFSGGTTHPGGGVPMSTLSGKVAAEMVLEDYS